MPPIVRILRTVRQVLVAIPVIVGALAAAGLDLPGPALVAAAGAAVLVLSTIENTVKGTGHVPVLRTLLQVVVALAGIVPAVVAGLAAGGIHVDGASLAGLAGTAIVLANIVQNLLEQNGRIPTVGASRAPLLAVTSSSTHRAGFIVSDRVPSHGINPERRTGGAIRRLVGAAKILGTSALRAAWAPACSAKGDVYLAAYRALDTVLRAHGYAPRREDTGAYNCRKITGGTGYSLHSYGPASYFTFWNGVRIATSLAVDINWTTNPYGPVLVTDMPLAQRDDVKRIRTNSGHQVWGLGADYRTNKDAMHHEIVCTPAQLATGINWATVRGHETHPLNPPRPPAKQPVWVPINPGWSDARLAAHGGFAHEVAETQMHLAYLGHDVGEIDGVYGPKTQAAVRAFKRWVIGLQKATGQPVWPNDDATVGPKTIAMLRWWRWAKG